MRMVVKYAGQMQEWTERMIIDGSKSYETWPF